MKYLYNNKDLMLISLISFCQLFLFNLIMINITKSVDSLVDQRQLKIAELTFKG